MLNKSAELSAFEVEGGKVNVLEVGKRMSDKKPITRRLVAGAPGEAQWQGLGSRKLSRKIG